MIYEIINPSDSYTIEANSLDIAAIACVILGNGQYAFRPQEDGAEEVPLFLFGGCDEWFAKKFGKNLGDTATSVMDDPARKEELAACLDSCIIGGFNDRKTYLLGLEMIKYEKDRERWWQEWHDKRRSSLNDIGGRAHRMAKRLRGGQEPNERAPKQVFG